MPAVHAQIPEDGQEVISLQEIAVGPSDTFTVDEPTAPDMLNNSGISLAAGSTDVGYPTEAEVATDSLRELLVQHMNETTKQLESLPAQSSSAAELQRAVL